ncbi:hypothetical protein [Fulvimarina sp. MAC8]|uniref:hypothetical protein n=1 Tax=Fulvimarina sp. MAC8 TaxID=3162874 RepID=UPI0032ECD002
MTTPTDLLKLYRRSRRLARQRHALQRLVEDMPDWQRRDIGLPATLAEETARPLLARARSFTVR